MPHNVDSGYDKSLKPLNEYIIQGDTQWDSQMEGKWLQGTEMCV